MQFRNEQPPSRVSRDTVWNGGKKQDWSREPGAKEKCRKLSGASFCGFLRRKFHRLGRKEFHRWMWLTGMPCGISELSQRRRNTCVSTSRAVKLLNLGQAYLWVVTFEKIILTLRRQGGEGRRGQQCIVVLAEVAKVFEMIKSDVAGIVEIYRRIFRMKMCRPLSSWRVVNRNFVWRVLFLK